MKTLKQPRPAILCLAGLLLAATAACSPATFHTQIRTLPETSTVIPDPVRTPAPDPDDYRNTAFAAIAAADENALRLLIAWCNYDGGVREAYATAGAATDSKAERCARLKAWLAQHPQGASQ